MVLPILSAIAIYYLMIASVFSNPDCPKGDMAVKSCIKELSDTSGVKNWQTCLDDCRNITGCLYIVFTDARKLCQFYNSRVNLTTDLIKRPGHQFASLATCKA